MSSEPETAAPSPPRPRHGLVIALAVGVGGVLGGVYSRSTRPEVPAVVTTTVVRPTPDVIVAVRSLARLESVTFHVERVVDVRDRTSLFWGSLDVEDAMLLVAAGDVVAGVDFTELRPEDAVVDWERRAVRLTLPPARVFSANLDTARTYVHSRDTDVLAVRSPSLETRARQEAERTLRQAALEGGILPRADRDAARAVEAFVRGLGFTDVSIRSRGAESATQVTAPDLLHTAPGSVARE